jgi:flagellar motility protein MotE (MotC chaperone)
VIRLFLTAALVGTPFAADDSATPTTSDAPRSGFSRFSEGGVSKEPEKDISKGPTGNTKKPTSTLSTTSSPAPLEPRVGPPAPASATTRAEQRQRTRQEAETKNALKQARDETITMLEEVRGIISNLEKGEPAPGDAVVLPPPGEAKGPGCDLELPQILAFELQRIRAVRDEALVMLEMHEQNLKIVQDKLDELEKSREQLDKSREALEETLSRKSVVDDEKEKERRRVRLLMSSRAMKPKKIAALMEQISLEEARVLLEALDDTTSKAVLEALPPERLSKIVSEDKTTSNRKPTESTNTASKSKETL